MPNHKSAIKRTRQNIKRRARNGAIRAEARTAVKKVRAAVGAGDKEAARKLLAEATVLLDGAAGKGVHHANNTGRRVSRLTLAVNKMP
jgi:small subunit ribosomal protein S20